MQSNQKLRHISVNKMVKTGNYAKSSIHSKANPNFISTMGKMKNDIDKQHTIIRESRSLNATSKKKNTTNTIDSIDMSNTRLETK